MRFTQITIAFLSASTCMALPPLPPLPGPVRKFLHMPMPKGPPGANGPTDMEDFLGRTAIATITAVVATEAKKILLSNWLRAQMYTCLQKQYDSRMVSGNTAERLEFINGMWAACKKEVDPHNILTSKTKFTEAEMGDFLKLQQVRRDVTQCIDASLKLTPLPAKRDAETLAKWLNGIQDQCANIHDPDDVMPKRKYTAEMIRIQAAKNKDSLNPGHDHSDHYPFLFDGRAAERLFKQSTAWMLGIKKKPMGVEEELNFARHHF
ncbi:MAG: hypothetical protein M1826_005381 [Phylliscum demangeonii]|nr:MAG: hypothetical protein M1826_005381 [Phylliscum demangeonii]